MAPRVLVIGSGSIGKRHVENLRALGARVAGLSWREAGLAGAEAAMAAADAVVVATATDLRLPLIAAAAARGLPVYVEKPLAFRADEVAAIFGALGPLAGRSMLGLMMRYHPAFRALAAADLGHVFQFSFSIGHDVTQWRAGWRFSDSYAARASGGGVLLDLCHEIDMAWRLFPGLALGEVTSLGHAGYPGVDVASRLSLSAPGVAGEVAMDYLTPRLHRRAVLRGTRGVAEFDFAAGRYLWLEASGVREEAHPMERNAMFLDAMRDFLALVQGHTVSGVEHLPRLDLCRGSADLVAEGWDKRRFDGFAKVELP